MTVEEHNYFGLVFQSPEVGGVLLPASELELVVNQLLVQVAHQRADTAALATTLALCPCLSQAANETDPTKQPAVALWGERVVRYAPPTVARLLPFGDLAVELCLAWRHAFLIKGSFALSASLTLPIFSATTASALVARHAVNAYDVPLSTELTFSIRCPRQDERGESSQEYRINLRTPRGQIIGYVCDAQGKVLQHYGLYPEPQSQNPGPDLFLPRKP